MNVPTLGVGQMEFGRQRRSSPKPEDSLRRVQVVSGCLGKIGVDSDVDVFARYVIPLAADDVAVKSCAEKLQSNDNKVLVVVRN